MKILNFGSLNIDYVYRVPHFVRAGETIASTSMETFCGGKGLNQSVAFAKAGASVYHAGAIGAEGTMLTAMLDAAGADTSLVRTVEGVPCGHAIIQVNDEGENCIMLCGGANQTPDEPFIDEVLSHFSEGDLLMLQNEINDPARIAKKAKEKGLTVILNPAPASVEIKKYLSYVDIITPNETELEILGGKDTLLDAGIKTVITTLGAQGYEIASKNGAKIYPCIKVKAVDTTAAGDTASGGLCVGLSKGETLEKAIAFGSLAASIACTRRGAQMSVPSLNELSEYQESN